MKKKFRVCYCFVDYHFYVNKATKRFTLYTGRQKVNNLTTITVVDKDEIARACFDCIYNSLLIRKFDAEKVNKDLNSSCNNYYAYSSHYERVRKKKKNCFHVIEESLLTSFVGHRTVFMSHYCAQCRKLVLDLLADEFYCIA